MVRRVGKCLDAADEHAAEVIRRLPDAEPFPVRLLRSRSGKQAAFYWRMLEEAVAATGRWRTPQELHAALRIATGFVDEVLTLSGRRVLVPASTAFDTMSQDEAQAYYSAAFDLLAEATGIEISPER